MSSYALDNFLLSLPKTDLEFFKRALAFEAETLIILAKEKGITITFSGYQKKLLDNFQNGLNSLENNLRYSISSLIIPPYPPLN